MASVTSTPATELTIPLRYMRYTLLTCAYDLVAWDSNLYKCSSTALLNGPQIIKTVLQRNRAANFAVIGHPK